MLLDEGERSVSFGLGRVAMWASGAVCGVAVHGAGRLPFKQYVSNMKHIHARTQTYTYRHRNTYMCAKAICVYR